MEHESSMNKKEVTLAACPSEANNHRKRSAMRLQLETIKKKAEREGERTIALLFAAARDRLNPLEALHLLLQKGE